VRIEKLAHGPASRVAGSVEQQNPVCAMWLSAREIKVDLGLKLSGLLKQISMSATTHQDNLGVLIVPDQQPVGFDVAFPISFKFTAQLVRTEFGLKVYAACNQLNDCFKFGERLRSRRNLLVARTAFTRQPYEKARGHS
jgi:hypothetical protein